MYVYIVCHVLLDCVTRAGVVPISGCKHYLLRAYVSIRPFYVSRHLTRAPGASASKQQVVYFRVFRSARPNVSFVDRNYCCVHILFTLNSGGCPEIFAGGGEAYKEQYVFQNTNTVRAAKREIKNPPPGINRFELGRNPYGRSTEEFI